MRPIGLRLVELNPNGNHHPTIQQVQWKTKTLAILHVGCFGVSPARRAEVMANLREQIWRAGGLVATPQSETEAAAAAAAATVATIDATSATNITGDRSIERTEGGARGGEESAAFGGESRAVVLPLTRTASDGERATLPPPASAACPPSSSMVTTARGGGVDSGSGGGSAGGGRPGLGPRSQSISATLTQKECLIHKVNAGLSGLETSIFFQLMLPESPSHPEAGRAALPRGASAAAALVVGGAAAAAATVPRPGPGPYPTFSGGASSDLVAAPQDRFAGVPNSRYVASYLRRQRWLWSFACPDAPNFGGAGAGAGAGGAALAGGDGGCDSAEWTTCRRKIINSLARSRRADGFVLVECQDNEALMVKGIRITLEVPPGADERGVAGGDDRGGGGGGDEAGARVGDDGEREGAGGGAAARGEHAGRAGENKGRGGGSEPRAVRVVLQYRVFEVSACGRLVCASFEASCWFAVRSMLGQ